MSPDSSNTTVFPKKSELLDEDWICEAFEKNIPQEQCLEGARKARSRLGEAPEWHIVPAPAKSGVGIVFTLPMGYGRLVLILSSIMYQKERWGVLDGVEIHTEYPAMFELCNQGLEN
jgi:hypothetical protein